MNTFRTFIIKTLHQYFPNPQPSLTEWSTPFQFLIAILLSGNSTDKIVNKITPKLFAIAPNAKTMSLLSPNQLESIIKPCGLSNRKGPFITKTSSIIDSIYQGDPPKSLNLLTQLPGIGRKTASVFLGQYYNATTFPVDTHILRLAQRWCITSKKSPLAAEKDLIQFFGNTNSPTLHLQLIYYARRFCPALGHKIDLCPICFYTKNVFIQLPSIL